MTDATQQWIPGPAGFDIHGWLRMLPRYSWTVEMIHQFPEAFRFEIIDGELLLPEDVWAEDESSGREELDGEDHGDDEN